MSAAAGSFDSCRDWLPVYSGDGKRLAIVNRSEIVIPRANGDILRRLPVSAGAVAWSPDGRRIAYTKSYTDPAPVRFSVFVTDLRGSASERMSVRNVDPFSLSWSSRGLLA